MRVKLCGFVDETSLEAAIANECDFIGFIFFAKSPRYILPAKAAEISKKIPKNIAKVAVVVNPEFKLLEEIAEKFSPEFFQFHGDENIDFLQKARTKFPQIKIIKAFRIKDKKDLEAVKNFEDFADFFLFDSKAEAEFGGSGKFFDWKILADFSSKKEWFLSGGLNIKNIDEALKISGATMVDISSGIEEGRGKKSPKLIAEFMTKIRSYDS